MSTTTVKRTRKPAPVKGQVSVKPEPVLSGEAARALILATVTEIGNPLAVIAEFDSVVAEVDGRLVRWFGVAVKAKASGIAAREFGTMTGTDKNWLGRLNAASALHIAHKAKGLTLSARDAVKVANVQSAATIDEMVKSVRKGGDPLATKRGTVKPNAGKARKATERKDRTEVKPEDYAKVVEWVTANIHKASADSQTRILTSALALVEILTAEGVEPIDVDAPEAEAV